MKAITEAVLRDELRNSKPETYYIPEGKILTPAAREYLQQCKIKISKDPKPESSAVSTKSSISEMGKAEIKPEFTDFESGAFYTEKPEYMTHLYGNVLVPKNHPRILFRGKLDSIQALMVLTQCEIKDAGGSPKLAEYLQGILDILREIMRCDVLDEPFENQIIIGLNHAELRERSHNPMKFYNIRQMVLPDASLGKVYALLNQVRTAIRETEVAAVDAFREGHKVTRGDIIEELNRLSSAIHILMCMYLAGEFK